MELLVVVFMSFWAEVYSKVYWIVSNKPGIYGDNIILTCKTEHVLTDRAECPVRQWYGGHKDKLLLYNKVSLDATKYEDRTNLSSTEFSLVIKNYTESDLNINYTCSCGFKSYTKLLGLNDEDFIVSWVVSNKPVMHGDNIILTCKTGHVLTDKGGACLVRQWYSDQRRLLYNGASVDATKYEERMNVSSTEFSLVIKNYTESDLNINYTCSCGFKSYTKCLALNDNNFIVPPLRVETHIRQSNEMLSIYIHIERVYPRPELSIAIGERTVDDNLTFTSAVKDGIFYHATFEASINIIDNDCGKKPTVLCYIGNKYNIVNTSGEPIRNCTEERDDGVNTPGYISTSSEPYTTYSIEDTSVVVLLVVVLACLLTASVIICKRKCRYIQNERETWTIETVDMINSDGDYRNEMWTTLSKIHKQNDSGVDLNDETCSLKSHANVSIEHNTKFSTHHIR